MPTVGTHGGGGSCGDASIEELSEEELCSYEATPASDSAYRLLTLSEQHFQRLLREQERRIVTAVVKEVQQLSPKSFSQAPAPMPSPKGIPSVTAENSQDEAAEVSRDGGVIFAQRAPKGVSGEIVVEEDHADRMARHAVQQTQQSSAAELMQRVSTESQAQTSNVSRTPSRWSSSIRFLPGRMFSRRLSDSSDADEHGHLMMGGRLRRINTWLEGRSRKSHLLPGRTLAQQQTELEAAKSRFASIYSKDRSSSVRHDSRMLECARAIVLSRVFGVVVTTMIVLNVAVIGFQADWTVKNYSQTMPNSFLVLDLLFVAIFTGELLLRLLAEGTEFFSVGNPLWTWNWFDAFLVFTAIIEEVFKQTWKTAPDMSAMRVLRIFRFIRLARIVRVARMFSDLRIMLAGILISMKSLMWALLLLFLVAYSFAVLILEFISVELQVLSTNVDRFSPEEEESLKHDYASLMRTMYTLYMSICGGIDWGQAAGPLIAISPLFGLIFCVYVAVAVFCVLNIVTGVFVENTKAMHSKDEINMVMETIESKKQWMDDVKLLWSLMSDEQEVDLPTFIGGMTDFRCQALFRKLGIDIAAENTTGLFHLLDLDGNGYVSLDEFAMGIQMVHGAAKNIDMARLRHSMRALQRQISDLVRKIAGEDCTLTSRTSSLNSQPLRSVARLSADSQTLEQPDPAPMVAPVQLPGWSESLPALSVPPVPPRGTGGNRMPDINVEDI